MIQKNTFVWWLELYEENSIIDWEWKNQEIFIIVVAVKEIDANNHKETTSQVHNIVKEVLFAINSGKLRSQNKNNSKIHSQKVWTSWVHSEIFICYDLLLALFCEKKSILLNKANRTTFLSTNLAEYSSLEKIFRQMYFVMWNWNEKNQWLINMKRLSKGY